MKIYKILNESNTFSRVTLIQSFVDQCINKPYEIPITTSLDSLSFSYLKSYITYLNRYEKLSYFNDHIIFESILNLQNKLLKEEVVFNSYDDFLTIFRGDIKEEFLLIIKTYIIPVLIKDLQLLLDTYDLSNHIIYDKGDTNVGFTQNVIKEINENPTIKTDIENKINEIDNSRFKAKPIFDTLEEILSIMYNDDRTNITAMTRIHMFGIAYGAELSALSGKERREIVENATGGKSSLYTELAKGISLHGLVTLKDLDFIPILKNSVYYDMEMERREQMLTKNDNNDLVDYNEDITLNNNDNNIKLYKTFERQFKTHIKFFKNNLVWNYNGKTNNISNESLQTYNDKNINIYEVLSFISKSYKYDGRDSQTDKIIKILKKKSK